MSDVKIYQFMSRTGHPDGDLAQFNPCGKYILYEDHMRLLEEYKEEVIQSVKATRTPKEQKK